MSPQSILVASQTDAHLGGGGATSNCKASLGLKDVLLLHMLPRRQSRFSGEAHDAVRSMAESWGITSFDHFRRLGVSFSSTVYPSATLEGLESACAHLSLWILLDDLCFDRALDPRDYGIASHIRRGASGVGAFLGGLCDLFRDPHAELPPGATPAETASWELGVEMRRLSSADWMDVFADHVEGYVAGNLELAEARGKQRGGGNGGQLPAEEDLEAYTRLRFHTSGCTFAAALVELTTGAVLPAAVRAHPAVQQLTRMAVLATCFANDIFSYHNETVLEPVEGDFHPLNVIQLFMDKDGLEFDCAADRAVQLVNSYAYAFLEIEANLPEELDEEGVLRRYVHGLKEYMSGWFHWHYNSNRYRSPGQPFPELRNRVVTPE